MEMSSKVLLLTKALQGSPKLLRTKAFQVENVESFMYSFVMTYGLLITYRLEGKRAPVGYSFVNDLWTTDYLKL